MWPAARVGALLCGALLTACSAADFGGPAQVFSQAVGEGARLVGAYDKERAEASFALRRAAIAQRADQVVIRSADCRIGAPAAGCVLRAGPAQTPIGRAAPAGRSDALADALERYAESLAAVATAATEGELDAAARRLADALDRLGGSVGDGLGPSRPLEPTGGGILALGASAPQQRRLALLRHAVNAADPAVQRAASDLAAMLAGQREAAADDRAALIARLAALYNAMEPRGGGEAAAATSAREALLTRLAELSAAQRRLLTDDPTPDLRALGAAHGELRRALNDPAPPVTQLTNDFRRLGDRLRRAADAAMRPPPA